MSAADIMLEETLLKGCLEQDRSCQRSLYKQYFSYSMSICMRYAPNREEAVEIVNDGFMKVFTRIKTYDPKRSFKNWLGRIMINVSIDHYRSNHKHFHHDDLEKAENAALLPAVVEKLAYEELLRMVQLLPSSYRTVFNLYVIDGYKHEEIAGMLSITVGTSKSNLYKARELLKRMIAASLDGRGGSVMKGLITNNK